MSRPIAPVPGGLTDAPAIHADQLSPAQRDGRSCCWCSDWAPGSFPVPMLRGAATLGACEQCAGLYGVPEVTR
ncbi:MULTISPECIES: hypothetical protein [Streptomyces]|uniref:hypothetical protein n=1 Tax=Streptomyces TaxID=1883 RepID=UPI0004C505DC|nr:hypothetical protein [Streptomyces exfoliatus]